MLSHHHYEQKLNSQGITNVLGGKFNINVVSRLLRNIIYTGQYFINGTIYTNVYPQIIDDTTFEKVNKMLSVGKHTCAQKKAPIPFLLSGKLVCRKCKALMTGDSGTGKNGIHYYNISDNSGNNIKLENVEDYTDLENKLNNKKEQSEPNGSDCSSLVRITGVEPAPFRTGT